MNEWTSVFLLIPRRIAGRWRWLSLVERREVCAGCAFYSDCSWEYRE